VGKKLAQKRKKLHNITKREQEAAVEVG